MKNVDPYERTVKVKWTVPNIKETVDFSCESIEETVSVFELFEHPSFSYCVGDIVLRYISPTENVEVNLPDMQSNDQDPRRNLPTPGNNYFFGEDAIGELIGGRDSDDFQHYLSCIGNVIGYKDKCVEVRWASGHVSKVCNLPTCCPTLFLAL